MSVRTRDDLMAAIRGRIGEDTSDEALALIEDFNDTLNDYDSRIGEDWKTKYETSNAEWEQKYNDNDTQWRRRYRDRFFGGGDPIGPNNQMTTPSAVVDDNATDLKDEGKVKTFEELFTEKEENSGY